MPATLRRPQRLLALLCILPLVTVGACGDDDTSSTDSGLDAGVDAAPTDAEPDGGPDDTCADRLVTGTVFELDPDGPDTQIHVSAAFDGEAVWVVWNRPDGASYFDVWAQRLGCDGVPVVPPFRVNTTDHNEVDPAVAVGDGNVYMTWSADNNTGINNMDILVRTYDVDGAPLMAADAIVETTHDGTPVTGNAMSPAVTALPGGQFAVAGVRGLDVAPAWQVFAQRLNADGTLVAEALSPIIEPAATHMYPAITGRPDGTLHLAYTRAEGTVEQVFHTGFPAGAATPDPDPPAEAVTGTQGTGAALASSPDGDVVYLAFSNGMNIVVTTTDILDPPTPATQGGGHGPARGPVLATVEGGGAMVYFVNVGGLQNELHAVPYAYDGTDLTLGAATMLIPQTVPPYGAALTHVTGDVYFVAWSGGANPDYRIYGMFVSLTP